MSAVNRQRIRLANGAQLSVVTAGELSKPALLLLHGFPSSARTFREVIPALSEVAYVIAPDLPGFGGSDVLPVTSFEAYGEAIIELLKHLDIGRRFIYLHDFGAPVGLHIAMQAPDEVLGVIVQNANAHRTGFGPGWAGTIAYWSDPNPQNEAAATAHLTLEGTRDQYVAGLPPDIAARISPENWEEDWRIMCLPGRKEMHRALIADYGNYAARFDRIAAYFANRQPPSLMLWGRHDAFFDFPEVLSWMEDLPQMEAHIFDAGHFLLETHSAQAAALMLDFMRRAQTQTG